MSLSILTFLAMTAAAPQPVAPHAAAGTEAGSSLRAADARVAQVVYRLASRGKAHCDATHPLTGLLLHHLDEYSDADRAEAIARFGIDEGPAVLAVVPGSPAARAGLAAGDVLLSVNGAPLPRPAAIKPRNRKDRDPQRQLSDAAIEQQARLGPLRFQLLRGGQPLSATLQPLLGCAARGRLARSTQANAFADGRYAIMTTRLLEFVRNDDELAVVMAHEIAHNLLGHPARLDAQKVPNGILRGFGKNAARVRDTEEEADRLAIKLLWAAGYDVSAAIPFWRRLYAKFDPIPVPKLFRTHPGLGARERLIQETLAELGAGPSATP